MIVTRSPLRVSLGGGGTDLPSYFSEHEGFLVAGAIDKYVHVSLHKRFTSNTRVIYSKVEGPVSGFEEIVNPIVRNAARLLRLEEMNHPHLEIYTAADIPYGTGLGQSSAFACALLLAMHTYKGDIVSKGDLAKEACCVEIDMSGERIGKQDQYASAFGGLNTYRFLRDGRVDVTPVRIPPETFNDLEDNLLLFYTGFRGDATKPLSEQDKKTKEGDREMTENLHRTKELGFKSLHALQAGDLEEFATLMNIHWETKKQRSNDMSNPDIDRWYAVALQNGALGGKLLGAGGGRGCLLFYAQDSRRLRHALRKEGLGLEGSTPEIHFGFDFAGARVVDQT